MGASMVIGIELNRPRPQAKPPRNLLHIMLYSLTLVQRPHIDKALHEADIAIRPDLNDFSVMELERVQEIVKTGREAAAAMVPAILQRLAALEEDRSRTEP
jgi:predicted acylesterase/phospholipase RssA